MQTREEVLSLMKEYVPKIKDIYGDKLVKVILYGSYARGDYNEDSDVDVMVLLDIDNNLLRKETKGIFDVTYDLNLERDTYIVPIIKGKKFFNRWQNISPLFRNIKKEGIILYDQDN